MRYQYVLSLLMLGGCLLPEVLGLGTRHARNVVRNWIPMHMQPPSKTSEPAFSATNFAQKKRNQGPELFAISIDSIYEEGVEAGDATENDVSRAILDAPTSASFWDSDMWQVLSAASLVTGNTVGAGMLVLPGLAAGPGFAISSAIFLGVYLTVLMSGLVIADVAINQHESGYHVPSSFQEFAEANLDNQWVARAVSAIPVFVNSLVMLFAFTKAGELGSSLLSPYVDIDPAVASVGFVGILGVCLSTMSGEALSGVASLCVSALLAAFGCLLLPGLASVQDPLATLAAPGLAGDNWLASVAVAAPIFLTALQFQNITPSLCKILRYDRTKIMAAISLGSFIPLVMYLAWCFAVLGGGIESSDMSTAGPVFSIFSASTLFGSSIGAAMSVTEEVGIFLSPRQRPEGPEQGEVPTSGDEDIFGLHAVLISLALPLAGVWGFSSGNDACAALGVAGSFGSPLLYGIVPALMALNQRQSNAGIRPLVPSGLMGVLGLAAATFVGYQVIEILSALR